MPNTNSKRDPRALAQTTDNPFEAAAIMGDNDAILHTLRAIVDAGGPQTPVRSHLPKVTPPVMKAVSPFERLTERELPMSEEPLAQHGVFNAIFGQGSPRSAMPSIEDVGGMAPILGMAARRPPLDAFKPRQPMPSARRAEELMKKFGGTGKDLPMDEASRMGRAEEQGYTTPVYHGTNRQFTEFNNPIRYGGYAQGDFGIHVSGDVEAANKRSNMFENFAAAHPTELHPEERGAQVMPLLARMQKTLTMPDMGIWKEPDNWIRYAETARNETSDPAIFDKLADEAMNIKRVQGLKYPDQQDAWQHKIREVLQDAGYDSIKYANHVESDGAPSYLLLDPRQLRSRFAKFDPANANSKDLMASLALMLGGGAAVSHDREE